MGKRLAESGYAVLVVNPFYRTKKAPTAPPNPDFEDPATRDALFPASVEVFEGTMHGWCPPDAHVYNRDAAEKAWGELLTLLKSALG